MPERAKHLVRLTLISALSSIAPSIFNCSTYPSSAFLRSAIESIKATAISIDSRLNTIFDCFFSFLRLEATHRSVCNNKNNNEFPLKSTANEL